MSTSRSPFSLASTTETLEFCTQNPASELPPSLLRRFLTTLTSRPEGVIILRAGDGGQVVGVTVDRVESAADCAVLELIGAIQTPALPELLARLQEEALDFVRSGARSGLEIHLQPRWSLWQSLIEGGGFVHAFSSHTMETAPGPPPPAVSLPGPRWRWAPPDAGNVDAYYAAVLAAMKPVPGAYISDIEAFREAALGGQRRVSLLLCGEQVAGFACFRVLSARRGYIDMIGRHPDFRGRGLGPLLLSRAMRCLGEAGVQRFMLDVTATNTAALALYQSRGFSTVRTVPAYRRRR